MSGFLGGSSVPSWVDKPSFGVKGQPGGFAPMPASAQPTMLSPTAGAASQPQQVNNDNTSGSFDAQPQTQPMQAQAVPPQQPQIMNAGNPITGNNVGSMNLPQNMQQILQTFMRMGGGGFKGLQPVTGNPFADNGTNLNKWGAATNAGIYGGT